MCAAKTAFRFFWREQERHASPDFYWSSEYTVPVSAQRALVHALRWATRSMDSLAISALRDSLAASWSSPVTPFTEARGYLVAACSTEQAHRSKRLIAQVLRQAAATNRTFVEQPGVAGSFVVEPWASSVAVCGAAAAGGARLYWDMQHLREAALELCTDIVVLDALGSRVAELLGSGVPPPGFDRVLDVLPCRTDLGVCEQGGGDRTALVDRPVAAYEQAPVLGHARI